MSRNIRQKFPPTPVKATKRRRSGTSSSPDLSDDDGYSAVEDISDSEDDDEEGVVAVEEQHIIKNVRRRVHPSRAAPRPQPSDDEDDDDADEEDEDDGGEEEEEEEEEDDDVDDDDDEEDEEDDDDDDAGQHGDDTGDASSWNGIAPSSDDMAAHDHLIANGRAFSSSPVKRQVRFDVPDSDSDSTTSEATDDADVFFPDIFVEQTSLDPAFRREIEKDPDASSNDSYWDLQEYFLNPQWPSPLEPSSDEEPGSSQTVSAALMPNRAADGVQDAEDLDGYDTDDETDTEIDEDVPPRPPPRKQVRVKLAVESSGSDTDRPLRSGAGHRRPRVGRFDLDEVEAKPIAFMHPVSRKMIIFTPEKARGFDLAPESFRDLQQYLLPFNRTQLSPIASHSGSLMMAAMVSSQTFGDFVNGQGVPCGPQEAFMAPVNPDEFESLNSSDIDFPSPASEENLKFDDFIQVGPSDDDADDDDDDDDDEMADVASPDSANDADVDASTPGRRPSTAASMSSVDVPPLLTHFDNNADTVGAFRRNQVHQQLISSEAATVESLAFSSGCTMGTLKGIKNGSFAAVCTPITPTRRQKRGSLSGLNDYDRSPLESLAQKRKASGTVAGEANHKRHRSISDVRNIAL